MDASFQNTPIILQLRDYKTKNPDLVSQDFCGSTQSRGRTGMPVKAQVFETSASTNSAIWAFLSVERTAKVGVCSVKTRGLAFLPGKSFSEPTKPSIYQRYHSLKGKLLELRPKG